MTNWQKIIDQLPDSPGVYIFKGKRNEPIYIGKANSLKSRVRSYFYSQRNLPSKTVLMLERATDLDYIVVQNELESLVLEQNLIKQFKPKFNVRIKDDKRYPWLRFTYSEDYPRLLVVRLPQQDNDRYYGPFPHSSSMRKTIQFLRTFFPIRNCKLKIVEGKQASSRPCLEFHLNRCSAPCSGYISKSDYRLICDQICMLLEGKYNEVEYHLNQKMQQLSDSMRFEEAAKIRDQLRAIKSMQFKQLIYIPEAAERDFVAIATCADNVSADTEIAAVAVFVIRNGKLVGKEKYILEGVAGLSIPEIYATFLKQHYHIAYRIPRELYLCAHPEDEPELIEWLSQIKEYGRFDLYSKCRTKISIEVPQRGDKKKLLLTVAKNAQLFLMEELSRRQPELARLPQSLVDLKFALHLPVYPRIIEAFDISNIGGTDAVGSLVVFNNGRPVKSAYRRFRIKRVVGINDYAMMQEVITRRFTRLLEEQNERNNERKTERTYLYPDLILIDGGLGHLHAAQEAMNHVFKNHNLECTIPIIGLAKRLEEIYLPTQNEPIILSRDNKGLHLLQRIRNEAHRFAITYHRQLRKKQSARSFLDELPGIGEVKKLALLRHFGSIAELKKATVNDLQHVPGIGKQLAETIYQYLITI
ncbi:MAG: excinuclease ABC subunit UvrC [bacterium]|nr:excinuclease ABC subunit UvrC [bacterium]